MINDFITKSLRNISIEEELKDLEVWTQICESSDHKIWEFFNNFYMKLPNEKNFIGSRNFYKNTLPNSLNEKNTDNGGSQLYLSQTLYEFYNTIDNTLKELNIYNSVIDINAKNNQNQTTTELHKIIIPAYFELRKMGYYRYPDLII